jgi:hypothetical protein
MKLPLVFLTLAMLSPSVQAFNCFEPSPAYLRLGETYFEDSEQKIVVNGDESGLEIVRDLKGEWEGELSELICEGTETAPLLKYREAEVEADVKASNTALFLIAMSKRYKDYAAIDNETVFLMNMNSMHSLRIEPNAISATERERRSWHGYRGGSRFVEVHTDIVIHNDDAISVDWLLFSNGVFVYSQRLQLERDL